MLLGFSAALAWNYLRGKSEPEVPPIVLITTVSLISAMAGFLAAVVVLILFVAEWLSKGFANDALLMKNLIFFFGHVLVNIILLLVRGRLTRSWPLPGTRCCCL
jgi:cytochrome c oxidase subunit 1